MIANILGTEYSINLGTEKEKPQLRGSDGVCDPYAKEIYLDLSAINEELTTRNPIEYYKQVLRHELIHAFFHECGMSDYYLDEKLVDALAVLWPKLKKLLDETKLENLGINANN